MTMLTVGSLFSGYGGLDIAVENTLDARPAWFVENDAAPSRILAHHWPTVPNLGDITAVDWTSVEPVDVLTGGSPCQDLSHAGKRRGMTEGTRSNLWVAMREAIATLSPSLVVWENVRGAYGAEADSDLESCPGCVGDPRDRGPVLRALGRVLGDLSDLGYDCRWTGFRAADVGAPHGRFRVFVAAYPADLGHEWSRGTRGRWAEPANGRLLPTPVVTDSADTRNATANRSDPDSKHHSGTTLGDIAHAGRWGEYAAAIHRWETLTRPAPPATEPGRNGKPQLSPAFSEWMMGLPGGHVTGVPGLSRSDMLKALGNGVVPQQAEAALRFLLGVDRVGWAA